MASRDGRIEYDFEKRGKKRPNPVLNHDKDDHADYSKMNNGEQQPQKPLQQAEQEAANSDMMLPSSSTGCLVCGVDDDHANLLLCEECNGEFHTYCLTPKLDAVPDYDWFCARCRPEAGDRLEELVCALPRSYTSRFGEICWAQGGVGFGWWPACIYDPRMTMGGARMQSLKHLGKRYLVFFFQCSDTPSFEILPMNKILTWEEGLAESFHLGKTARGSGKTRHGQFRKALQEACMEESLPKERRLDWNHQGGTGAEKGGTAGASRICLPSPKKISRGRKRRRTETTTTTGHIAPAATTTNDKDNRGGGAVVRLSTFAPRVVEKKVARRTLPFTARTQHSGAPAGDSMSTGTGTATNDDSVPSSIPENAANVHHSGINGRRAPAPEEELRKQPGAAATTPVILATAPKQDESTDGVMYCKVQREIRVKTAAAAGITSTCPLSTDDSSTVPVFVDVGFVRLDSRESATFAVCRQVIEEELASDNASLPPDWEWRFLVPNLGPLSIKQESRFGPMLAFLNNVAVGEQRKSVGNGSLQNPVQITLVDAPHAASLSRRTQR